MDGYRCPRSHPQDVGPVERAWLLTWTNDIRDPWWWGPVDRYVCRCRDWPSSFRGTKWLVEMLTQTQRRAWALVCGGLSRLVIGNTCFGCCRCREWLGQGLYSRWKGRVLCTWSACFCRSWSARFEPVDHKVLTSQPWRSRSTWPCPHRDPGHTWNSIIF